MKKRVSLLLSLVLVSCLSSCSSGTYYELNSENFNDNYTKLKELNDEIDISNIYSKINYRKTSKIDGSDLVVKATIELGAIKRTDDLYFFTYKITKGKTYLSSNIQYSAETDSYLEYTYIYLSNDENYSIKTNFCSNEEMNPTYYGHRIETYFSCLMSGESVFTSGERANKVETNGDEYRFYVSNTNEDESVTDSIYYIHSTGVYIAVSKETTNKKEIEDNKEVVNSYLYQHQFSYGNYTINYIYTKPYKLLSEYAQEEQNKIKSYADSFSSCYSIKVNVGN